MQTISEGTQGSLGVKQSVLSGKNYITNPRFSGNTNGWSGTASKTVITGGVSLTTGTFYQTQNTTDIASPNSYMARCFISATDGTSTMDIGTTSGASDLGTIVLVTGWNGIKFDAGTTNFVSFNVTTSLTIKECHLNPQVDLYITGNFINA